MMILTFIPYDLLWLIKVAMKKKTTIFCLRITGNK
jgi:hypothetical protein